MEYTCAIIYVVTILTEYVYILHFAELLRINETFNKAQKYCKVWKDIGIELDISIGVLNSIEEGIPSDEDCLRAMIAHWIRNTTSSQAHAESLNSALQSERITIAMAGI